MAGNVKPGLDWLRAKTDQQLLEYKSDIEDLIADFAKVRSTQPPDFVRARFIAHYLYRTAGFDQALEFLNTLNREAPGEAYYFTKIEFLLQHERSNELEIYLQELTRLQISDPLLQMLCLQAYLGLGQHQRAASFLSSLITDHPRSGRLVRAITLATIFDLDFDRTAFGQKVRWGKRFLALEECILGSAAAAAPPVVHCINLDRSPQRMARSTDLYRGKAELHRIPGVPGDALPDYLLRRITINPAVPKTAIGCSLSHIAAWERIAENDEAAPLQIIVEDDGLPVWVNRASCGAIRKIMQQQELDLLYIHSSASPLEFSLREISPGWKPEALPFQAGLERFLRYKRKLLAGWGLFGYCLSVPGARKLLALLERDGLTNHVDWQTFLYSVTDWDHPAVRGKKNVALNYRRTAGREPQCELDSGILNFPMIAHVDFSRSTR